MSSGSRSLISNLPQKSHITWQNLKESLAHSIQSCNSLNSLQCLHSQSITSGLHQNLYISSHLITQYFHFKETRSAPRVFGGLIKPIDKTLVWNSLIKGYLRCGLPQLALNVYDEMIQVSSLCGPDKKTFHLVLTACAQLSEFGLGFKIEGDAKRRGLQSDTLIATALIGLYLKAEDVQSARRVFEGMRVRDVVAWNAMLCGYSRAHLVSEALDLFMNMRAAGDVLPTEATMVSLLSCCKVSGFIRNGEAIHAHVVKVGFVANLNISNCLMEMYIVCDRLDAADKLFRALVSKDAISWSTMIGGYVEHERPHDALSLFHQIVSSAGILPTRPILLNAIHACAQLRDYQMGMWIKRNYLVNESGELISDAYLVTSLIYLHAKCGEPEVALELLANVALLRYDTVAWNAIVKACAEDKNETWVLKITRMMQRRGIKQDATTLLPVLSTVSSIPLPRKGLETHGLIVKNGFEAETTIANSLIDMYARSGSINDSCKVFYATQQKDVVTWSSMIKAYAWHGKAKESLDLFQAMRNTETRPNQITFLALLSACSHAGLVEEAKALYESMEKVYGLQPCVEHFTCMVDVFCRAGHLKDAYHLLENAMQKECTSSVLWGTLLGACRAYGDLVIGEAAARHLFLLEPNNTANYLMLAEIYVSAERRDDANNVLGLLREKGLVKEAGCCWFD